MIASIIASLAAVGWAATWPMVFALIARSDAIPPIVDAGCLMTFTGRRTVFTAFDASYTWSKSLDYNSFSTQGVVVQNSYQTIKDLLIDLKSFSEELSFAQKLERSRPPRGSVGPASTSAAGAVATDQAGSVAPTADQFTERTGIRHRRVVPIALVVFVLAALVIGGGVLWRRSKPMPAISTPTIPVQRAVSYWISVQKYRDGKPYQDPFRLRDDFNFEKDYRIRLNITSSQSGRLYLLNESPARADQTPTFNVMFPSTTANQGSALLTENQQIQIPQQSWFHFDEQQGTEKIWLVWAQKDVPKLEAIKGFANPRDRGIISSPGLRTAVNEFLRTHSSSSPSVERDQEKKETVVRANGEILVHVIKLEHHSANLDLILARFQPGDLGTG
jgi:hypothetical protein